MAIRPTPPCVAARRVLAPPTSWTQARPIARAFGSSIGFHRGTVNGENIHNARVHRQELQNSTHAPTYTCPGTVTKLIWRPTGSLPRPLSTTATGKTGSFRPTSAVDRKTGRNCRAQPAPVSICIDMAGAASANPEAILLPSIYRAGSSTSISNDAIPGCC